VTEGQVAATALQVGGEPVTIPYLGTAVMGVERGLDSGQQRLASSLGTTAVLGTQGLPYLLLGFGLVALAVSLALERQGSATRERTRDRSRGDVYDTRTLVLGLAALLIVVSLATMVAMSGTTETGIICAEFDSDCPDVIPAGETETHEYELYNGGLLPTVTIVEPASEGVAVDERTTLGYGENETATVAYSVPPETGYYLRSVEERSYFAVLPEPMIVTLHAIHPWMAMGAVTAVLTGLLAAPLPLLIGTGSIRTRSRRRSRPSGEETAEIYDPTPTRRPKGGLNVITDRTAIRLHTALDEWFVLLVVALLGLSLLGGWAAYGAVADDGEEIEHQTVEVWSTTTDFDHGVTVQEENEVFPVGAELSDQSAYFAEITPELEAAFRYRYDAPAGDVAVDVEAERVIRSVGETDDVDPIEYWTTNETIAADEVESLGPGEELTTAFAVDVPEMAAEADDIQESLDDSAGTVETIVEGQVAMEGAIDGEPIDQVETYELVIQPDGSTYAVSAPDVGEQTEERTEEVAAAGNSGVGLGLVALVLVTLASMTALGALVVARARGVLAPNAAERERMNAHYEREEFDDWISRGTLPAEIRDRSPITIATREAVDVGFVERAGRAAAGDGSGVERSEDDELDS
jgi:hypothetical protein